MGCDYITTCNYGFKSLKDDWEELVRMSMDLIFRIKNKNYSKFVKVLGCLPPYFESYHDGEPNTEFVQFYEKLIEIMDDK